MSFDLRYRVFLNPEAVIPVATFIIQSYAEEFASKFNNVDLWVVRDLKNEGIVVARNRSVPPTPPGPVLTDVIRPGNPSTARPRRRSTD